MTRQRFAWIVLLACSAVLAGRLLPGGASRGAAHRSYAQAAGYGLGLLLARDIPNGGTAVYLIPGASDEVIAERFRPHADGMAAAFGGSRLRIEIEVGEGEDAPRRSSAEMLGIPGRSLADAAGALKRHPGAVAMVTMAGPNDLPPPEALQGLPPLYVLDPSADARWPLLLRDGIVRGVVVRDSDTDLLPMPEGAPSPADVFHLRYRIVEAAPGQGDGAAGR